MPKLIPTPAHLADVRVPALPHPDVVRAKYAEMFDLAERVATATSAWQQYERDLITADEARHGQPLPPRARVPEARKRRAEVADTWHKARLASYLAELADHGRQLFRTNLGDRAVRVALRARRLPLDPSDLPDLPRRCDLTDASAEALARFEAREVDWFKALASLSDDADAVVDEALEDMGYSDADLRD
jgi:hypothetical protein